MFHQLVDDVNRCTVDLTSFLKAQPHVEERVKRSLKSVYDLTKKLEDQRNQNTLSKLLIKNFDDEQIWQQLSIQNEFVFNDVQKRLSVYLEEAKIDSDLDINEENEEESSEAHSDMENDDLPVEMETSDVEMTDKQQVRFNLNDKIEKLEKKALEDKPWQLKGETSAKTRPENSLLETYLEFDITQRPAPVITEEAALKLEDIILRRIKDKAWDDVERKIKPVTKPYEFKKKLVLDQEKSKISLAEVYEQEYLKQRAAVDPANKFKDEEEPKEYKQIRSLLDSLFSKLDGLSNYHYNPIPAAPEVQIVSNLPAVTLEEGIPAAVSDAVLLAPEEVQAKQRGELKSAPERTSTDKKRSRRKKKLKQKALGNRKQLTKPKKMKHFK